MHNNILKSSNLALQQVSNIDIRTLDTGRYYVTNSSNLPTGWIAAYLDVERIDNRWCRVTAWPPYKGLDIPQITKQCDGEWLGWGSLITSTEYNLQSLAGMDFFIDTNNHTVGLRWMFGANKEYGYALNISMSNGGMWFYYLNSGQWMPAWTK